MSEIRVTSISVSNYRSFREKQTFYFPPKSYKKPIAIVGYNNSGKTNLMNCILYGVGEKYVSENTFDINDLHNIDTKNNIKIIINIEADSYECPPYKSYGITQTTNSIRGEYTISTKNDDGELQSKIEQSMFGKPKHYNIFYINFHSIKDEISTKKTSWGKLSSFLAKHIKRLVDTDNSMKDKRDTFENQVKEATSEVLKNSELDKFINKIQENYTKNLRNVPCDVSFGLPDYEDIFLQMIFKIGLNGKSDKLIPIDHFGDGYISMFVMAVIQAIAESDTKDKCLFLFEEPESFLHENHQEYFYNMVLCGLAENGHQVIYTTHSDKMVDMFDTQSIIRIEFDEDKKQTVKKYNEIKPFNPTPDAEEKIINYANYNSYIKSVEPNINKILFSRKVILVEGANDILAYKTAIEKEVTKKKGEKYAKTYLSFLNIAFIVHHGKPTAYLLIDLCKHFGLEYFVINDWDFDDDFIDVLSSFSTIGALKSDDLYRKENGADRSDTRKSMVTVNWTLLNSAGKDKIHFNVRSLETFLEHKGKSSLQVLEAVKGMSTYPDEFFPQKLRDFLEFYNL